MIGVMVRLAIGNERDEGEKGSLESINQATTSTTTWHTHCPADPTAVADIQYIGFPSSSSILLRSAQPAAAAAPALANLNGLSARPNTNGPLLRTGFSEDNLSERKRASIL